MHLVNLHTPSNPDKVKFMTETKTPHRSKRTIALSTGSRGRLHMETLDTWTKSCICSVNDLSDLGKLALEHRESRMSPSNNSQWLCRVGTGDYCMPRRTFSSELRGTSDILRKTLQNTNPSTVVVVVWTYTAEQWRLALRHVEESGMSFSPDKNIVSNAQLVSQSTLTTYDIWISDYCLPRAAVQTGLLWRRRTHDRQSCGIRRIWKIHSETYFRDS
jgi:hypothetical protein